MKFYNYQPTLKCPICGFEYDYIPIKAGRETRQFICDSCETKVELIIDVNVQYSAWTVDK